MSEHQSRPGADELDTAFIDLVEDVGARSRPPGADRALRSAGRRRIAVVTTAVVLVTALVVGLGGWAVQNRSSDGAPVVAVPGPAVPSTAASSAEPDVPPARFTVKRLGAASAGWARWEEGTVDVVDVSRCLTRTTRVPEPRDLTTAHYRVRGTADGFLERARFASGTDSDKAMRAAVVEMEACPEGTAAASTDFAADLEVVAFTWGRSDRGGVTWLVNHGTRMDTFHVVGAPRPSDEVVDRVSRLVAEDVQVP